MGAIVDGVSLLCLIEVYIIMNDMFVPEMGSLDNGT